MEIKLNNNQIKNILNKLKEKQEKLSEREFIEISEELLELLLFSDVENKILRKDISLKGLDLSKTDFTGVDISRVNFNGSNGAKINPQAVKDKNCHGVIFNNVKITGPFDGCDIVSASFAGSQGAEINPQTVKGKNCYGVCFTDTNITDSFDYCIIDAANFIGSQGAKINPQTICNENCHGVNFADSIIIGSFDNCDISYANFKGSKGAQINPQTIKDKNCNGVNFNNVKITGPFNGCNITGAKFKGSTAAKINPKKLRGDFFNIDFADVEFLDTMPNYKTFVSINFKGSKNAVIDIQDYYSSVSKCNLSDVCINVKNIDIDKAFDILVSGKENIYSDTTLLNGLKIYEWLEYLENRNKLYNSYLNELDNYKLSLKK